MLQAPLAGLYSSSRPSEVRCPSYVGDSNHDILYLELQSCCLTDIMGSLDLILLWDLKDLLASKIK